MSGQSAWSPSQRDIVQTIRGYLVDGSYSAQTLGTAAAGLQLNGLDWRPAARAAVRAALLTAARAALLVEIAGSGVPDSDWDTLSDEQRDQCVALVDHEPPAVLARAVGDLLDRLAHLAGGPGVDVLDSVVDDGGHVDLPTVGHQAALTAGVDGTPALATPAVDGLTVGPPTDAAADLLPAAVSVDRDEMARRLAHDVRDVTSRQMLTTDGLAGALADLGWIRL